MKKLMIAAAIVCAAVVSQGANYYWNINACNGEFGDPDATWNGASAMAVLASTYDAALANSEITSAKWFTDNALTLNSGDGFDVQNNAIAFNDHYEMGFDTTGNLVTVFGADKSATESFYFVLLKDGAITDGGYFAIRQDDMAGYASTVGDTTTTTLYIADLNTAWAAQDGTWTAYQTVPEPTSGLLLLLGVAGLALRRRRA